VDDARDVGSLIDTLYLLALGRIADPDGRSNARAYLASGANPTELIAALLQSPESAAWRAGPARLLFQRLPSPPDEALVALAADPHTDVDAVIRQAIADLPIPVPTDRAAAAMAREALLASERMKPEPKLWVHGWKAFSQADEDGILAEIFRRIGLAKGLFLEIGAADGMENITSHWLMAGWRGVWVEGDPALVERARAKFAPFIARGDLQALQAFVDPHALDALWSRMNLTGPIDLLSVDIDGNDFGVVAACLPRFRPKVMVVEYNPKFGPDLDWVMPFDPDHRWGEDDWYGASLAAYTRLAKAAGLVLVGCNMLGSNAFFVRGDLADVHFGTRHDPAHHYEPARYHLLPAFLTGHPVNRDRMKPFAPQA
jgi:hypothetical protein